MAFRPWILEEEKEDRIAPDQALAVAETPQSIEELAWRIIITARNEITQGGAWKYSEDVEAAEKGITEAYREFMAGRGGVDDLRAACERWKRAGSGSGSTKEPKQAFGQAAM